MDCPEKRLLLRKFVESNQEYRAAIARCRLCRSCSAESPAQRTTCQLDEYLTSFEHAHKIVLEHCEEHGC